MKLKSELSEMLKDFYPFAKKELGFHKPARVFLKHDAENAKNPIGKTAYYDPQDMKIVLYYADRHPKDVLRSFAHELMHHKQNCDGRLEAKMGEGPATQDENLQKLEEEANMAGFLVRSWEEKRARYHDGYLTFGQAKEEGEYMQENKRLQEKKKKKTKIKKKKKNPWAICTSQVGRKPKEKYEKCVLSVKDQYGIKKEQLKESKLAKNPDVDRDLGDLEEKNTIKDHYSKRAERLFDRLMEKYKSKQESEVSKDGK
jgi:hypothetical protein